MWIAESWCSCSEEEPKGCHIVLKKNLTKKTAKVICRGGGCDTGNTCKPVPTKHETSYVHVAKDVDGGSEIDVADFMIMVELTYECQCSPV